MIAPNNDPVENPQSALGDYGGGISAKRVSLENARLLERATREKWPIPDEYRKPVVERMYAIATNKKSKPREASVAARVLVSMEAQNTDVLLAALDKVVPDLHEVGGTVEHRVGIESLYSDPDYVEYLRHRTINEDCDAGAVCQIRESGNGSPVANGKAHGDPRPGANGHRNGS